MGISGFCAKRDRRLKITTPARRNLDTTGSNLWILPRIKRKAPFSFDTLRVKALSNVEKLTTLVPHGSAGRTRTYNPLLNRESLYR